jgi:uncharacterized protein YndB with AHSA1/START domain
MGEVRASTEINAPREAVWEVVADVPRLGEWVTIHEGFEGSPPTSVQEGTRFTQKLAVAGKDFAVEWTASEVSEPELLEWQDEGPGGSNARARYELSGDNRTAFTYISEINPPGGKLGDAAATVVENNADEEANNTLERRKRLVES